MPVSFKGFLSIIFKVVLFPGDRLIKSIKAAMKEYVKKPVVFGWTVFISIALNIITLGALTGAFLIIYYMLSMIGLGSIPVLVSLIAGILFILYLVIANGLKGALIKTLLNVSKKERPSIVYFFKYGLERGEIFFGITFMKSLVALIPIIPLFLLYNYVLLDMDVPYLDWIAGVVLAGIFFVVEIPFVYAYVAAACNEAGVVESVKSSLRLLRKKHAAAFGLYTLYAITWVTLFIPLLNIISIFVIYPVMYTAVIFFHEKYK